MTTTPLVDKVKEHMEICQSLNDMYSRKNADYGDSFRKSFEKWGMIMPIIRLSDKLNRIEVLSSHARCRVNDESLTDTLLDLANYAIMTVLELNDNEGKRVSGETDKEAEADVRRVHGSEERPELYSGCAGSDHIVGQTMGCIGVQKIPYSGRETEPVVLYRLNE